MTSPARVWLRRSAAVVASLALFAGTAELAVRLLDPTARVQVIRHDTLAWQMVHGAPQWSVMPTFAPILEGRECQDDRSARQVALIGDSVLQVSDQDPHALGVPGDTRTRLASHMALKLQDALNAAGPQRWCVRDLAQSGYLPYQFHAALQTAHARAPVDVVVLEVFKEDGRYTPIGQDLYNLQGWRRTAAGSPNPWGWVPDPLQDTLFRRSAAWAYASLAWGGPDPTTPDPQGSLDGAYRETVDWSRVHGLDVLLLQVPMLDIPFAQSAEAGAGEWASLESDAAARGVGVLRLAEALKDQDVTQLRMDTCCHYGPAGHAAIARVLADALLARLPAGSAPTSTPAAPTPAAQTSP